MSGRRKAFTLVELLAAMSVFSVIFGTVMLALYAMQKSSRGFSDGMATATQRQRFASQLRDDVHQAQTAVLKPVEPSDVSGTLLELTSANNQVIMYRLREDQIERQVSSGETIIHQDSFSVSPVLEQGWSLDTTRATPLLTVHLYQNAGIGSAGKPTLLPMRVAAALRISAVSNQPVASATNP